ncbi:hypothetical protein NDA15_006812 [Ustilago hordei]|nr:hypothetical protein NDA15_006812 [Ustilago hordei]
MSIPAHAHTADRCEKGFDCGSAAKRAGSEAPGLPTESRGTCAADSTLDKAGPNDGLGGPHVLPRGAVGDEGAVTNTEEGSDGEVMAFAGGAVNVAPETVRIPTAEALDGLGAGAKAGRPRGGTASKGMASIGRLCQAGEGNGVLKDGNERRVWEGVCPRWAEAKEGGRRGTTREQVAKVGDWAFWAADKRGDDLDAKVEGVHLGCRQGDDGMVGGQFDAANVKDDGWVGVPVPDDLTRVQETGKGEGEHRLEHGAIAHREVAEGIDSSDKAAKEGQRDGELGAGVPSAMDALVATQSLLEMAALKAGQAEAKVDVVGAEVAELVLGGVV